jgi:hypothetical protein
MNIFLFRLSRLLSTGIFIIVIGLSFIIIDRMYSIYSQFYSEGIIRILLIKLGLLSLILVFNWMCFKKVTIWVKKNKEN